MRYSENVDFSPKNEYDYDFVLVNDPWFSQPENYYPTRLVDRNNIHLQMYQ